MSFDADIVNLLLADSVISPLLKTIPPTRIEMSNTTIFPCAVYEMGVPRPQRDVSSLKSLSNITTQEGEAYYETDLTLKAVSNNYTQALGIASRFRKLLNGLGNCVIGSTSVDYIRYHSYKMSYNQEPECWVFEVNFIITTKTEPNFLT